MIRAARMLAVLVALAAPDASALFIVNEPWVRVAPNMRSAEVYMRLTSTEGATVVGVASDEGGRIEIRAPGNRRTLAKEIRLPPGDLVALAPNGYRFALSELRRSLKLGDRVMLTLIVEESEGKRIEIPVNAEVRKRSPTDDHKLGHRH